MSSWRHTSVPQDAVAAARTIEAACGKHEPHSGRRKAPDCRREERRMRPKCTRTQSTLMSITPESQKTRGNGRPEGIRTPDLRFRKHPQSKNFSVVPPLEVHSDPSSFFLSVFFCRTAWDDGS